MSTLHVVTGANGLLGSHLVEKLIGRGETVRALVRRGSDTAFLRTLGVTPVEVDWTNLSSLEAGVAGAKVVYHCAARVSDWGPWQLFQESIVDTTQRCLEASRLQKVGRVVYVSSSRVYGHPKVKHEPLTEDDAVGQRLWRRDYYPRAKIACEQLCQEFPGAWTIVRPTWMYGERDRNTLTRLLKALELGQAAVVGSGENTLPLVYAGDAAEGLIRAGAVERAIGRTYNLSDENALTQRQLLNMVTEGFHLPPLRRRVPYGVAFALGAVTEIVGRALRVKRNLRITRHSVSLMANPLRYSSAQAQRELEWFPQVPPKEGLQRTIAWYREHRPAIAAAAPAYLPEASSSKRTTE